MSKILFYTFRTNRNLKELAKSHKNIFVFGKLREDFPKFMETVRDTGAKQIIGLAEVKTSTRIEVEAINKFGRKGKVNREGKDSYRLDPVVNMKFPIAKIPTHSFCNWVMYKISENINPRTTKNSFIHFNQKDLSELNKL